jgi:outer membrane immunogenic protein
VRPVVVAAPVYTWTGFYIGGNLGYSWGHAHTDLTGNGVTTTTFGFFPSPFGFTDSNTARLNGVIGGGQLGYNYQFSPNGVLGFEADFQGSHERGSGTFTDPFSSSTCHGFFGNTCTVVVPIFGTAMTSYQAKIDWTGTVRLRLGILVTDQLLIYGTGGLAYGRVSVSGSTNLSAAEVAFPPFTPGAAFTPATAGFGASKTNVGFSVGGGIEGRLSYWLGPNWTFKLEYLYLDLGSLDTTSTPFAIATSSGFILTSAGTINARTTHFTDNILRVGLNYKFGNYYAPVVTK